MRNYTTSIEPTKTLQEIIALLGKRGKVESIIVDYDGAGTPDAIMFSYRLVFERKNLIATQATTLRFRLPCRWQGVQSVLKQRYPARYQTAEHAKRVAWRVLKDWIDAQLSLIEAGAASLPEVFLPYATEQGSNQTLYESFIENRKQLHS